MRKHILSVMYKLFKQMEMYLPFGYRVNIKVEKRDEKVLPDSICRLSDITGYKHKKELPEGRYYLSDIVSGKA